MIPLADNTYCLILAGGNGKRLWPYSRRQMPKQFLDFLGTGKSLLRLTYERFAAMLPASHILISTYFEFFDLVHEQLPEVSLDNILIEPTQLNTAPAAAWATLRLLRDAPEARLIVTPADHLIPETERYTTQITQAVGFVTPSDGIVVMGTKPTNPNTNYGYIQKDIRGPHPPFYKIKSFTEKPDTHFAEIFIQSGEFLWNTGLFVWHVQAMQPHLGYLLPMITDEIEWEERFARLTKAEEEALIRQYYPRNTNASLDMILLNHLPQVVVQETDFGWVDLGNWIDIAEAGQLDENKNAMLANSQALMHECEGNIIKMPQHKMAFVHGLKNFLVVDHENALLICPKEDAEAMRHLMTESQLKYGDEYI